MPAAISGHRPPQPAGAFARRLRQAAAARRPQLARPAGGRRRCHRAAAGGDHVARGVALREPTAACRRRGLVRASRLPRACRRAISRSGGRPGNALVGFTNMLLRLWQAERPRAVVIGWDTLDRADLPTRSDGRLPGRPRVRRCPARAARPAARARVGHRDRLRRRRPATRPTTSSPPLSPPSGSAAAPSSSPRPTATPSSSSAPTSPSSNRSAASVPLARIGPTRYVERYGVEPGTGDRLHRAAR